MIGFLWSWLVIGCCGGLAHWYMTRLAQLDEIINDEEADWLYKLTPLFVVSGPIGIGYMLWVAVSGKDDEE